MVADVTKAGERRAESYTGARGALDGLLELKEEEGKEEKVKEKNG